MSPKKNEQVTKLAFSNIPIPNDMAIIEEDSTQLSKKFSDWITSNWTSRSLLITIIDKTSGCFSMSCGEHFAIFNCSLKGKDFSVFMKNIQRNH